MPDNVHYLWLRFFDAKNDALIKKLTFFINATKDDKVLIHDLFYTKTGLMMMKFFPSRDMGEWTVNGTREPTLGGWMSENDTLPITTSVFAENGIYRIHLEVLALVNANELVDQNNPPAFDSWWSVDEKGNISKYVTTLNLLDAHNGTIPTEIIPNNQVPLFNVNYSSNPVIITQVELASPFVLFPDNQTCYNKPGFASSYTCSTDVIPGHKVQCGYFIGSGTCEPIHQYTGGINQNCLGSEGFSNTPQWFDVYNTLNKTIQLQYFTVKVPTQNGSYYEDGPHYTMPNIGPHEKCTYGFYPVDEPISLDPANKTVLISYDYDGKHYTSSTPLLTDIYNDNRTWQFNGEKWTFAEQNTVAIPEFGTLAVPVLLIGIISVMAFYRSRFAK
jgi:predicted secreted protein with PEFG-CTERM motif